MSEREDKTYNVRGWCCAEGNCLVCQDLSAGKPRWTQLKLGVTKTAAYDSLAKYPNQSPEVWHGMVKS